MAGGMTYRRRVARKHHWCFAGDEWGHPIRPGDVYLECTEFPGDELGYADTARMPQCADCARDYGHGDLLTESVRTREPAAVVQRPQLRSRPTSEE